MPFIFNQYFTFMLVRFFFYFFYSRVSEWVCIRHNMLNPSRKDQYLWLNPNNHEMITLDHGTEHVAHVWRKIGIFSGKNIFVTVLDLNNWLDRSNNRKKLQKWATSFDLPYNIYKFLLLNIFVFYTLLSQKWQTKILFFNQEAKNPPVQHISIKITLFFPGTFPLPSAWWRGRLRSCTPEIMNI